MQVDTRFQALMTFYAVRSRSGEDFRSRWFSRILDGRDKTENSFPAVECVAEIIYNGCFRCSDRIELDLRYT